MTIRSDNPVSKKSEDALGRFPVAQAFVTQVLALDASEGAVVGVLGRWGSGKTSFVNFAREGFAERGIAVLDFNPWMFSGAEQLVDSFFIELSAQLRLQSDARLEAVANALSDYGEAFSGLAWLPVVGPWVERSRGVAKYLGKMLARRNEGIGQRKKTLEDALNGLDAPIVVLLDDIDRLTTDEIRDIFKLVRLTASLPNIVYVLAFDRARIETALGEQGITGRDYLEKIIQVTVDLPAPSREAIGKQTLISIDELLKEIDNAGPFDEGSWPDIAAEVIIPLVRTMRDVRRYVAALHGTLLSLDGQVALQDVLALESIRVFLPDVFSNLAHSVDALTETTDIGMRSSDSMETKSQVEALVAAGGKDGEVVRSLLDRVFPAAKRYIGGSSYGSSWNKTWLAERRVASEAILRLYLERVQGERLAAFAQAEALWSVFSDQSALKRELEEIDPSERENVIEMLESFEQDFGPEHVIPGLVVLLNEWPNLPEKQRAMFDFGSRVTVSRVTYRLVRSLKDQVLIDTAVQAAMPQIETLAAQLELISGVGYREGAGHKLVSESDAAKLETEWAKRVQEASSDLLMADPDLLRTLFFAREILGRDDVTLEVENDPELTLQILRSGRTYTQSQTLGSRAVRRELRLPWGTVEEILGTTESIQARIEKIDRTGLEDEDRETLELADRYLGGWRPNEFGANDD